MNLKGKGLRAPGARQGRFYRHRNGCAGVSTLLASASFMIGASPAALGQKAPVAGSAGGQTTVAPSLLTSARVPAGYRATFDPTTRRSRFVAVKPEALGSGETVKLNLFPDATFDAHVTHTSHRGPGRLTYGGTLAGDPNGSFTYVQEGDAVAAEIHSSRGNFEIRTAGDGVQMVRQVNDTRLAGCGSNHQHVGQAFPRPRSAETAGDAPVMDLMIVYTSAARAAAGGTSAMQALAQLFVEGANTHFVNSQINAQVRLVYAGEVNYPESGSANTDLDRLTNLADGFLDEVHALRDQYGADQVTLLVNQFDYCGIAWLHYGPTRAFSVVDFGCGSATFTHELGHNLGCAHDRQNSGASGYYPYSFGHRFYGQNGLQYRTVMSYAPGTRIPYFSNPNVYYNGVATGVPDGQPNSADNARTVNFTAATVAAYRQSADMVDCNGNFVPDDVDVAGGTSEDCNGNTVPDECDVSAGDSDDGNGNGVPDECECDPSACDDGIPCTIDSCNPTTGACVYSNGGIPYGDLNQSGVVDLEDVSCVLAGYERYADCPGGDLAPCAGDGSIDLTDLLAVLDAYNGNYRCPSPCP